jgi:uncharacterized damage-inducible protein DinB
VLSNKKHQNMALSIIPLLLNELEQEANITRKMLAVVPNDKYDWKPHPKSMTVKQLATHIGELPGWITMAITTSELDFAANPYKQDEINNTTDLLAYFGRSYEDGKAHLQNTNEAELEKDWTLRTGDIIHVTSSKYEVIRMTIAQIIHHRAQLGVFMRLLNIPIPGSYGPSADELGL